MDSSTTKSSSASASHLCVLVHEDQLVVYSAKRNTGSLTYDGIEIGAERVTREVEDVLEQLARDGHNITKFSIVGYSLGGLVARYVVGLLYHKGYFEKISPVNFTTFATPHLGVRTPLLGYQNHLWNVLGARTLSTSGRQLFTIDNFRDTGRPLLAVLADPESIFIHALSTFKNRTLYTNIVNDRTAVYYTTGIARKDPYTNLDKVKLNYVKGYEPVLLDPDHPVERAPEAELPTFYQRIQQGGRTFARRAPIVLALCILVPIAISVFLANSAYQTVRSRKRIQLHERDSEGLGFGVYRIPYVVQEMRVGLEDAFENVNSAQTPDMLPDGSEELSGEPTSPLLDRVDTAESILSEKSCETSSRQPEFPTLALTPDQFSMISALDQVGWRKFGVHITKSSHSHAAIIVRTARAAFEEGKLVVKHWLTEEFEV
ncbi:uncharacterized protein HMPREF1541_02498 [Cyphellophora europaea CBS 101466]|uniref:DUF676 domain-containing protein n=1 Tax=Cyphellophora europaea (strain CBS 101466) TaxID=1220924 RepID=W2S5X4_CYPE1|nr:uncharacterized protein HMPREF1541_02498 [Cyphellophora europaea CBS 101466]ETN43339.1 hypothetical protein HMPREF1541_02498 [Cyphellophora europaea CBS 101466]